MGFLFEKHSRIGFAAFLCYDHNICKKVEIECGLQVEFFALDAGPRTQLCSRGLR